ncbi:MAG: DnaJ domain-containing protein, partial [Anaerolineae bacterium]|nr:DnaJ domain-containing protein [Anaerolineae bacterium]
MATRLTRLENSYARLGLRGGATSDEVKNAYRRLARELHPDVSALPKD